MKITIEVQIITHSKNAGKKAISTTLYALLEDHQYPCNDIYSDFALTVVVALFSGYPVFLSSSFEDALEVTFDGCY